MHKAIHHGLPKGLLDKQFIRCCRINFEVDLYDKLGSRWPKDIPLFFQFSVYEVSPFFHDNFS